MIELRETLRVSFLDALAVVFPVECAGCGIADRALCAPCRAALVQAGLRRPIDETPAFAALSYEGGVRRSILALKESGRTDVAGALARPLAVLLDRTARSLAPSRVGRAPIELVTVPPSLAARRRRGYDPVTLLLGRQGLRPARVLRRRRRTASQKSLSQHQRATNRRDSLEARHGLAGRAFIIVDDVVTTGATVREATRALTQAGAEVIAIVALAATPRRDGSRSSRWESSW